MNRLELIQKENEEVMERYELSIERIRMILAEHTVAVKFQDYFRQMAEFIMLIDSIRGKLTASGWESLSMTEVQEMNTDLYSDVLPDNYEHSYANPAYAVSVLGETYGGLLSALYVELRGEIPYVFEGRMLYLTICNELCIELYNCFEDAKAPEYKILKDIFYWYANDYCDVFQADRINEQINPDVSFAVDVIETMANEDEKYLYRFGEYITENEILTARYLQRQPEEIIQKLAGVYTEGYRKGFVSGGIDLSKKSVVSIRYCLGFERVIKQAIVNFKNMGLRPVIQRAAVSVITKRGQHKTGYFGAIPNKQYEYDHRADQGLFMDKKYIERKLDVAKNIYEKNKELASQFAGPAVIELFGEIPFSPIRKKAAVSLDNKQEQLSLLYDGKSSQLVNQYIKGEERSFTIIAFPTPEIGKDYEAIFEEIIRINTLDAEMYEGVQQILIDALDQGDYVHIIGTGENGTDLKVKLFSLTNPDKETLFENCVADVNIPVGEVFTSPVLAGTEGILAVSKVFLNELQYRKLKLTFKDGKLTDYTCSNFDNEEDNKKYIKENILHNHETLALGEFAIGTNTTAYAMAKKYGIQEKLPILIAEKMGPHFAVGDTCYSWSEDKKLYNPNGKEIIAKDNEVSILRKKDISKAYFSCHTDITIPYEELQEIKVVMADGKCIELLKNGRFVLAGTQVLNEPLEEL